MEQTPTEVRLVKPGAGANSGLVNEVLGSDEPSNDAAGEPFFSLEYQLRDFLASNLSTIASTEGASAFMLIRQDGMASNSPPQWGRLIS
jgi:endonuclease